MARKISMLACLYAVLWRIQGGVRPPPPWSDREFLKIIFALFL